MPENIDTKRTIFAKTALGQQQIQTRDLGLSPIGRRALVLVDGKRTADELSVFLVGKGDIAEVLEQLLQLGCIEAVGQAPAATTSRAAASHERMAAAHTAGEPDDTGADLAGLPPADSRSAQDNEMARNFMINSINAIIGQNMRVTLVTNIFQAQGSEGLRKVYRDWETSMAGHSAGARRLPELREKLFKIL